LCVFFISTKDSKETHYYRRRRHVLISQFPLHALLLATVDYALVPFIYFQGLKAAPFFVNFLSLLANDLLSCLKKSRAAERKEWIRRIFLAPSDDDDDGKEI
jgi:hypothetical protein